MRIELNSSVPAAQSSARATLRYCTLFCAFASLLAFIAYDADARGRGGGGGFRGGAAISGGGVGGLRGNGGLQRPQGSKQRPNATAGQRPSGKASSGTAGGSGVSGNRASVQAQSGNTGVAGNGNRNVAANGNTGVAGSGNGNNAGAVNNGNVNNGNIGSGNVNTGNVVAGNDVDVNVENGGWAGYPYGSGAAYATGVAVGATTTAAAIGSTYYSLPSSCYPYAWNGYSYYSCGGTWYQQRYQGSSVTYVVVADPTKK